MLPEGFVGLKKSHRIGDNMRMIYLVLAGILFAISIGFASSRALLTYSVFDMSAVAPNNLAGMASCGFAIAGGLSLLASALVKTRNEKNNK